MLKGYKILTVTHRHTKLHTLGKYIFPTHQANGLKSNLENLKAKAGLSELMYLASCNRVMYFFYIEKKINPVFILKFFRLVNPELKEAEIFNPEMSAFSLYEGGAALSHLFKVCSSIDSMVVGEREILRQSREAYQQALDWKLADDNIRIAMDFSVLVAKKIYSQTRIGEKPVSVVSLAIQQMLATNLPKSARMLLVGAGQTNTLVAKFLKTHEFQNVQVFNRSLERAEKLVSVVKLGHPNLLSKLADYDKGFDCMIVCTGSTEPIITSQLYKKLIGSDNSEKILIDLSIPHNVCPQVVTEYNTNYIEIEGLRVLANENMAFRRQEVVKAKALVESEINNFGKIYQQRKIERALKLIPLEIKAIKTHAMNQVFKKEVDQLDKESKALIEKMMTYMEKRCIGIPMKAAKDALL